MNEEAQNRLALSCYLNTPESELDGATLEEFTATLKAEWLALNLL
jgi:hypothetical protein